MNSENLKEKHFCRKCKGPKNHKILHEYSRRGEADGGYIHWSDDYSIIQCLGCDTVSFLKVYGNSEMIGFNDEGEPGYVFNKEIYPPYLENGKELDNLNLVPEKIRGIYQETISAFKARCYILTAGGLRAIIEATCNDLNIEKRNLEEKINALFKNGHLSLNESKRLHLIRFFGNDALHEIEKPSLNSLSILLDITNHLLSNLYINETKTKENFETIVDNFDDFLKLIEKSVYNIEIGSKIKLSGILGRSKRLIFREKLDILVKELHKEIDSKKITFLKRTSKNDDNLEIYEVIEKPLLPLPF